MKSEKSLGRSDLAQIYELLECGILEIRRLCWAKRHVQAADLADALHNIPSCLLREKLDFEHLGNELERYTERYRNEGAVDYRAKFSALNSASPSSEGVPGV